MSLGGATLGWRLQLGFGVQFHGHDGACTIIVRAIFAPIDAEGGTQDDQQGDQEAG